MQAWERMSYFDALTKAMTWLGEQPDTLFLGQSIAYSGNALYKTLPGVPLEKRIELPVAEEMQMGMSIGLALTGKVVVSIYPRFDFLLLAVNQLVNHLDKLSGFTHDQFKAKVIIRVGIGSRSPLYPGVQHCSDYTDAFKLLLKNIPVVALQKAHEVEATYRWAYALSTPVLLVEDMDLYHGVE